MIHTLTRAQPAGWTGYARRIDRGDAGRGRLAARAAAARSSAGRPGFVEAAADGLVALGHDPARVKTERFGPTGGADEMDDDLRLDGNAPPGCCGESSPSR